MTVSMLALVCLWAGCDSSGSCSDHLGNFPPESITVMGISTVEVPYTAWECPGYNAEGNSGSIAEVTPVDGIVMVDVELEEGARLEIRQVTNGTTRDLAPFTGEGPFEIDMRDATALDLRVCSDDGRCALYEVQLEG